MTFTPDYGLIETEDHLARVVGKLLAERRPVGFDVETGYDGEPTERCQLHPEDPRSFVVSFSLTNALTWARSVPLRHDGYPNLDNRKAAEIVWPLAQSGLVTAWNAKMELRWMSRWFAEYLADHPQFGDQVRQAHLGNPAYPGYFPVLSDPMLERHAEGKSRSLKLKECTKARFGHQMMEIEELFALPKGKPLTKREENCIRFNTLDLMGPHRQAIIDYCCEDALWELAHHLDVYYTRPGHQGISDPAHPQNFIYRLEMAILPIVCGMEDEGIELDWAYMREGEIKAGLFRDMWDAEILDEFTRLRNERGIPGPCTVNLASPAQKARLLYEDLGLPVLHRTKKTDKGGGGNPSTDAIALEGLRKKLPVIQWMLDRASLEKLRGTYLAKYPGNYSYAPDGRTHPNWMQCGVPAGRFACSEWPVQQSPKTYFYKLKSGAEFRYNFRYAVKAPEDWYFLTFDYAQQERRALAGEAAEPALLEVFQSGVDVHRATAAMLMGKPIGEITKDERQVGKTLGFAMDYGLAPEGLADRMGISVEQAQALYDRYFEVNSRLKPYTERVIATARRDGHLITRFGRRVPLWGYESSSRKIQADTDRVAGNAVIQGPATGDYPKIAMVRQHEALRRAGLLGKARLIMNMHDALGWYVHKSVPPLAVIRVLQPAVVFTMPQIAHWPPIVAEWSIGERWGAVEELDVTLDESGVPVALKVKGGRKPSPAQEAADDKLRIEATGSSLQAAFAEAAPGTLGGGVPPAVAGDPPGEVLPVGGRAGGSPVAAGVPGAGLHLVIRASTDALPTQAVLQLREMLRARPGQNAVSLALSEGEPMLLAEASGFTPAQWPEAELILNVDVTVQAAAAV